MAVLGRSRSGAPPDQILDPPLDLFCTTYFIAYYVMYLITGIVIIYSQLSFLKSRFLVQYNCVLSRTLFDTSTISRRPLTINIYNNSAL